MKAAITLLCRGYPSIEHYGKLLQRNEYIFTNFNYAHEYPLIIFHEGNIPLSHQRYIKSHTPKQEITFIDIADKWVWPDNVPKDVVDKRFHLGYSLMCRFNCYYIWDYVKDYDYIWRIDEDTLIGETVVDPFQTMEDFQLNYMMGRVCYESHEATNTTIPKYAHDILGVKWKESDYVQNPLWVPYTNLYVARPGFFLQPEVQDFLQKITSNPMFLTHRWGDHVVSGIVLKAFSNPYKVLPRVPGLTYYHGSHHCKIIEGRAVSGLLSKEEAELFDCVPTGDGDMHIAREYAGK